MVQSTKWEQTYRHREETCDCQGEKGKGVGWTGSLGLAGADYYI